MKQYAILLILLLSFSNGFGQNPDLGKILKVNPDFDVAIIDFGKNRGLDPKEKIVVRTKNGAKHVLRLLAIEPTKAVVDLNEVPEKAIAVGDPVISIQKP